MIVTNICVVVLGLTVCIVWFAIFLSLVDWRSSKAQKILYRTIPIILSIGTMFGVFVGINAYMSCYNSEYTTVEANILSLDRGTEVSGSFVLGSGSVKEHITYYYYVETERGYKLESISTKKGDVFIVEDDNKTPCLVKIKEKESFSCWYVLYVPEGTIVRDFVG